MPPQIAIGFDFDHTLGLDNKVERTVALDILARLASANEVTYDVDEATRAMDETLELYRAGKESVEAGIAGFLSHFVPGLGRVALDEAQSFRETIVERAPDFITELPHAQEMLTTLDGLGIRYAILTNGWSPLQEEKARLIGFRGSVFVSERIGARKPSREAFETLTNHFDLPPDRVWYVGDDPDIDSAGARAFGLTAVWFDWEQRPYPSSLAAPDYTIHSLAELAPLVQGRSDVAANSAE
ncbi:MAG: HAD family hydrolase [Candidatus Eremiobacteraeota bacterium]|nr:HAD family hydrolase [Candidatus Eremiobacteraeota bacterium]